jgi:release factor glutamine methyltransferase
VLIPRPETEILVETALKYANNKKILDLGTGSGCIAVSISRLANNAEVSAADLSIDALGVAKDNACFNKAAVKFIHSDLFSSINENYDIIISNPPYIPVDTISSLQPELKFEPLIALSAGVDGLDFYRRIIVNAPKHLKNNGLLIMEMGFRQSKEIKKIINLAKEFEIAEIIKDYNNIDRVIVVKKGKKNG